MRALPALLALSIAATLPAQYGDATAVDSAGNVYLIDSWTGTQRFLLNLGISGSGTLASDSRCRLWVDENDPSGRRHLGTLGNWPFAYTRTHADIGGLVELAWNGTDRLFGVRESANGALYFCEFDTQTGTVTTIGGGIGSNGLRALAVADGRVYGWDRTEGLIEIDAATGIGTDVDPRVGTGIAGAAGIQALMVRPDGELVGVGDGIYRIDRGSGQVVRIAGFPAGVRIVGVNQDMGLIAPYGSGCTSGAGTTSLQVVGAPGRVVPVTTVSGNHEPGRPGFLLIGLSRLAHMGYPLPLALHMFGGPGCHLYTSIDVVTAAQTSQQLSARLTIPLALPAAFPCTALFLQHLVLRSDGRLATTNGIEFRPIQ